MGVREQRPGLAYIAKQCGAIAIVFDDELAARVPDAADAPALALRVAASSLDALGAAALAVPAIAVVRETDVAVILYTSGTTGHPKGAMLTHLPIAHSVLHYQSCMGLHAEDRSALAVPASHVTGLIAIIATMWQVGVALPAADIRVMDDDGREVAPGQVGELWIAGAMVVPGDWADAAATAASFTAGHWHSGDIGSVDAQGFVRIVDRKKDMLNRGGFKVYSVEVENVLRAWPGVVEAAVIGRPCPVLGERVHAVVDAPGTNADEAALRTHCAERLADYKLPESIRFSAEPLPRSRRDTPASGVPMTRSAPPTT